MDLQINDLKISYHAKNTLHELGFTMVSDLEGQKLYIFDSEILQGDFTVAQKDHHLSAYRH